MVNEGLGWDSLLRMVHNLGGHWHPVRGATPNIFHIVDMSLKEMSGEVSMSQGIVGCTPTNVPLCEIPI